MPKSKDYYMDFRPKSYWGYDQNNAHIGSTIKGELRRITAKELAKDEILDPVIYSAQPVQDRWIISFVALLTLHGWGFLICADRTNRIYWRGSRQ